MDYLKSLNEPELTAAFQRFWGVSLGRRETGSLEAEESEATKQYRLKAQSANGISHAEGNEVNGHCRTENNNSITEGIDETGIWREKFTASTPRLRANGIVSGNAHVKNGVRAVNSGDLEYTIKYKSVYYLSMVGAFLGNETFYLLFYPFCIWNLDSIIGRDASLIWGMVMYLGQATKDYLKLPRPRSPPVVRLESEHLQEFSMPSTHAMAGTAIPMVIGYQILMRYQVSWVWVVAVAFAVCALVCFSRLYLGVHSVLDVLCGCLYAIAIVAVTAPYLHDFDLYQQTHPFAPFVIFITGLALCTICYPSKDKNSAKGDAVQIIAAVVGCMTGLWLNYQLGITTEPQAKTPYTIMGPTWKWAGLSLLRLFTGAVGIVIVRFILKSVSVWFFSYYYGLDKPDKNHAGVQTAYKFISFLGIGICIMEMPILHRAIGIGRSGFFSEVY